MMSRVHVLPKVVPQRLARDVGGGDFLFGLQHEDVAKAPAFRSRSDCRSCPTCRRTACGLIDRSLRPWLRSGTVARASSARWRRECSDAREPARPAACGIVLYIAVSTTVSRPAAKRLRAMKCSSSNARGRA